jgi:hypothetical protein
MSASSIEMELSREFVLEKVSNWFFFQCFIQSISQLLNVQFSSAFWQYHISAWELSLDFFINSKKCLGSISIQGVIRKTYHFITSLVNTGMEKL